MSGRFPGKDEDAIAITKQLAKMPEPTVGLQLTCMLCHERKGHNGECPWQQARGWMEAYG